MYAKSNNVLVELICFGVITCIVLDSIAVGNLISVEVVISVELGFLKESK